VTGPACVAECRCLQCPQYSNGLCIRVVEPCLDITVNLIVILSTALFGSGQTVGEMQSFSIVFCRERYRKLERVGAVNVKRLK
jgi:hypothetical protein